jgi:hypothetical protein
VIVALGLVQWLDRSRLAKRATEADSYEELSGYLIESLREKNPAVKIEIHINGKIIDASEKRIEEGS